MLDKSINVAPLFWSVMVCLVLLAYQIMSKKRSKSDKWMNAILISNIAMLIGDMADCGLRGHSGAVVYYLTVFLALIVYFSSSGAVLFSILGWMATVIGQKRKISPKWVQIGAVLTGLQFLLAVTMPFTKICYIDPATNAYTRGELFILTQFAPYAIYILALILMIKHIRSFTRQERVYMFAFALLPLAAEIIQVFYPRYVLMNVTLTVGLVMIVCLIQAQREALKEQEFKALLVEENEKLEDMSRRQEDINSQLIDVLCGTVEAKDLYTRGHSMRVAQYAREIMFRLGGDEKAQQEVYCIGILHDVGKIKVRDEIINKNGRLTDEEYEQIKLHTVAGYQILRDVDLIPNLAIGARWHHERYDGKGYPNGLAGENIPLIARIISVADAYDAMTSNRSYHTVMPQADVREQIRKGMGTQFDPKIAQIMLDMIDEDLQYEMKQNNFNPISNILVIDDDTFIHDMVDQALRSGNYILTYAHSGEEGIELLKTNKYDLCLLDMEMPGMNGFEVLKWINQNVRKQKVIFLTGDKSSETILKSEELGVVDYVTKPINVRFLKESINSVLKQ